jgi:hypothetical protein
MSRVLAVTNCYRDEWARLKRVETVEERAIVETIQRYFADPWSFLPRCRVSPNPKAHCGARGEVYGRNPICGAAEESGMIVAVLDLDEEFVDGDDA